MEDFNASEMINARDRFSPPKSLEPAIDLAVTKIVGKKVYARDPRLINLIIKWKKRKGDDDSQDNFLEDKKKIDELKKVFNTSL